MWKLWYVLYCLFGKYLPESRRWKIFKTLRRFFAKHIMCECSNSANIEKGAHFGPEVSIGDNSSIGVDCELFGPIEIGKNVMMGPETVIMTFGHGHDRTDIPMIQQGTTKPQKVKIEDDVWIGRRCMILPGVTVGRGSILAAGAVITKNVPPFSVMGGYLLR